MMRIAIAAALVAGCGGGASIPGGADPSTRIISSNCQLTGNTVTVDVAYDTTLAVGQAWESTILLLDGSSFGAQISENFFFSCGAWSDTGSGLSAKGCQRNTADVPAQQNVSHTHSTSFENQIVPPLDVMIFAETLESPGGINVGSGTNDQISCF